MSRDPNVKILTNSGCEKMSTNAAMEQIPRSTERISSNLVIGL